MEQQKLEDLKCFRCNELGHLSANCPAHAQLQLTAPEVAVPWCGQCDPRTRHMRGVEPITRCDCHPLRRKRLVQHKRCKGCRKLIYAWDAAECHQHAPVGPQPYVGKPPAPEPVEPRSMAARQVEESRREREYKMI
jgi:Zinc knuckle